MRIVQSLLRYLVPGLLGVLALSCQTYDFEPVEPLALSQTTVVTRVEARNLRPNLMLLVDTSGSMTDPVDTSLPACRVNGNLCGYDFECPASCPSRWRDLKGALNSFLTDNSGIARMGLTTYPWSDNNPQTEDTCLGSQALRLGLPAQETDTTLRAHALQINQIVQGIPNFGNGGPSGGTPTASSLTYLGSLPELQSADREDFILLLTDGLPNCNSRLDGRTCRCTLPEGCATQPVACLDLNASVAAVQALRNKGIRTIVIGFGADTALGDGPDALNGMAEAGGFARTCSTNADCGTGDSCNTATQLCNRRYYQARNQAELTAALRRISETLVLADPCLIRLDAAQRPSNPALMLVFLDGVRVESTENGQVSWELTADGLRFQNDRCEQVKNSDPANPVRIELRTVQRR
jgi:hypothetical protein